MAAGSFILRPSADIVLNHTLDPDTLAAGYLAICEEVSDEGSTHICVNKQGSETSPVSSQFRLSGAIPTEKIIVTKIQVNLNASMEQNTVGGTRLSVTACDATATNGEFVSVGSLGTYYDKTVELNDAELVVAVNNYIRDNGIFPIATLILDSWSGVADPEAKNGGHLTISQAYVEVLYETLPTDIGIHQKVNGAWIAATAAYQKQNGTWVEITAQECKNVLASSLCLGGAK